jgi:hypothetical protein
MKALKIYKSLFKFQRFNITTKANTESMIYLNIDVNNYSKLNPDNNRNIDLERENFKKHLSSNIEKLHEFDLRRYISLIVAEGKANDNEIERINKRLDEIRKENGLVNESMHKLERLQQEWNKLPLSNKFYAMIWRSRDTLMRSFKMFGLNLK